MCPRGISEGCDTVYSQLEQPRPDDPMALLSAAARLRRARSATRREARLRVATSQLMETVAAAGIRDRAAVPAAVRRAAATLADEVTRLQSWTGDADIAQTAVNPRPGHGRAPFTACIRLGRMG